MTLFFVLKFLHLIGGVISVFLDLLDGGLEHVLEFARFARVAGWTDCGGRDVEVDRRNRRGHSSPLGEG